MSQYTAPGGGDQNDSSTMKTAAHEASAVTGTAKEAAHDVASTGAHEAAAVAGEAKDRVRDLVSQTGRQLSDQAGTQQQRLAEGLGSVGNDLSRMADADENGGLAGELVRRAAGHVSTVGSWLGDRDPQALLEDVKGFARRRPGTFIAVAALAGIVVGRLSRSIAAGAASSSSSAGTTTPSPTGDAGGSARGFSAPIDAAPVGGLAAGGLSGAGVSAAAVDVQDPGVGGGAFDDDLTAGGGTLDDTGLVAGVDGGDPPVYAESAARLDTSREGDADERPDAL